MESGRQVRVTCKDGDVLEGQCWAYSSVTAEEELGIDEPVLDIKDYYIRASEIAKIEYCD